MNLTRPLPTRLATGLAVAATLALGFAGTSGSAATLDSARTGALVPVPPGMHGFGPADTQYFYAAGEVQEPSGTLANGATATFTVEHPKQVPNGHSLAELAVEDPAMDYSYIEAGWIVQHNKAPHLFIFWWLQNTPECYDQGCGYVQSGNGIQPGAKLKTGSSITLTWQHSDGNWWLIVNGKKSGYYPDSQWSGAFDQTGFAQTFGEVAVVSGNICHDMGDGKPGASKKAATITGVQFVGGSAVALVKDVDDPAENYTMAVTGADSMGYGGPGLC